MFVVHAMLHHEELLTLLYGLTFSNRNNSQRILQHCSNFSFACLGEALSELLFGKVNNFQIYKVCELKCAVYFVETCIALVKKC